MSWFSGGASGVKIDADGELPAPSTLPHIPLTNEEDLLRSELEQIEFYTSSEIPLQR